ncbi:MAG: UvrD-helicase domain-containing protein, partial [Porticoccaceae bacterium]
MTDQAQRLLALDPKQSFIVSAPAGSGKTGLITQRLLRLLCVVENPEEILCITFTKKAASEMASRVQDALHQAAYQPKPTDSYQAQTWDLARAALARNTERNWGLLEMPTRLRIQTIDSFCRYIASQFALETSLGELPEPMENPEAMYQAAARAMLDCIEENSDTGTQLRVLVAHTGNDLSRCENLLADMLAKRDQWLPYIFGVKDNRQYFQQVIEQTARDQLEELAAALGPIAGELIAMADFAAAHLPENKPSPLAELSGIAALPPTDLKAVAQWRTLLGLLVTQDSDPNPRKTVTKAQGFPADEKQAKARMLELLSWYSNRPEVHELVVNCYHLPDADIALPQQALLDALGHLLPLLAGLLNQLFLQHNSCDYTAIMLASLQALEQSPEDGAVS